MNAHGIEFRDYQCEARDAAFADFEGGVFDSSLVVMPTGTGKTVLAGMCVEEMLNIHDKKTLFIAHREVLIEQAWDTMSRFGFNAAIEMGQQDARQYEATVGQADVVVGSIQTLQSDRLMRWNPNEFGLIIIDDCHRALADSYTKTLNWFRDFWLLGITATPRRGDERNLGARFKHKAYEYKIRRAIQERWIVPIKIRRCPVRIDLRGIKTTGGDFTLGELAERIGPKIEQLARAFLKEIGDKPAVAFLPDVGCAQAFAQACDLIRGAETARYVAGQGGNFGMTKADRKLNLADFKAGKFQIVVCCELLIEGWDEKRVEAVGIIRPTLQQHRYMQMIGRGTRPCPETGKTHVLVVDFDWETDESAKDLCSAVDIFDDGSVDEEVFAVAKQIAAARAVDVDPLEVIEEAERIIVTREKLMIHLTGKEAKYEALEYDPIGVSKLLDISLNRKYDIDKRGINPASDKQLGMLRSLGITTPENLSKWGASKMIDKIMKRKDQNLASPAQVKKLLVAGVNPELARAMSFSDASISIHDLNTMSTLTQRSLFS